jgi:hypothetical protein
VPVKVLWKKGRTIRDVVELPKGPNGMIVERATTPPKATS